MLCPRCDYDLTGLPERHTCPECGCNYDEHSIGIPLTGRRSERRALWIFLPLGAAMTVVYLRLGASGWHILRHLMIPIGFALGFGIRTLLRAVLPTRMVLDRGGVEFVTPQQEPLRWAWGRIGYAELGNIVSFFTIYSRDEVTLFNRYSSRLGSRKLLKRCAAEINERVALYRASSEGEPPD